MTLNKSIDTEPAKPWAWQFTNQDYGMNITTLGNIIQASNLVYLTKNLIMTIAFEP